MLVAHLPCHLCKQRTIAVQEFEPWGTPAVINVQSEASDFIVTLCEFAITFSAFIIRLCGFVICQCWFNITLFNLFITFRAFPNTFYGHFISLCHYGWLMPYM